MKALAFALLALSLCMVSIPPYTASYDRVAAISFLLSSGLFRVAEMEKRDAKS